MVNKIAVNPLEVRGAGNIVSPKTLSDFNEFNSDVTSAEEVVNGTTMTVYTESYLNGSYMTVTAPKYVNIGTESATISAVLKYSQTGSLINSAPIECYVNDLLIESKSTDGNGTVSFTIPVTDTVSVYTVKLRYAGNTNVAGCFTVVRFYQYDITDLNLIGDKSVIQSGDTCNLIAILTGTGVDGETIPISGQTVSIYEEYTPALGISSNKNIIQSGETANISLQLKDAEDGSLVRKSGVTIELYKEIDGIIPPLDGTDRVSSWTTMANRTGNGIFRTHGSYLYNGWDNSRNWILEFDYRYAEGTAFSVPRYVGIMPICSREMGMYTYAKLVDYAIACWEGDFGFTGLGRDGWISSPESTPSVVVTDWNHIIITKLSSTRLKIVLNDTYTWIGEFPNLANLETLCIGSIDNPQDRNRGSYVEYKDIILEYR